MSNLVGVRIRVRVGVRVRFRVRARVRIRVRARARARVTVRVTVPVRVRVVEKRHEQPGQQRVAHVHCPKRELDALRVCERPAVVPSRREARIQQQHVQLAVACNDRLLAQGCGERAHRAQIREVERRLHGGDMAVAKAGCRLEWAAAEA